MSGLDRADELLLQAFVPVINVMFDRITTIGVTDEDRLAKHCYTVYLTKAVRVFRCFAILAKQGYLYEAGMLTRTVFEVLVDLSYLSKSPSAHSEKFCDYIEACECRAIRREDRRVKSGRQPSRRFTAEKRAAIEEAKTAFLTKYGLKEFPEHWSGMSVCKRAEEAGLLSTYLMDYHVQSDYVHNGPYGFVSYMDFSDPNVLRVSTGPDWTNAWVIIGGTCSSMIGCLMIIEGDLQLSCYEDIHALCEVFYKYSDMHETISTPRVDWRGSETLCPAAAESEKRGEATSQSDE